MIYFPLVKGKYLLNGKQPSFLNLRAFHLINVFGAGRGDLQLLVGVRGLNGRQGNCLKLHELIARAGNRRACGD